MLRNAAKGVNPVKKSNLISEAFRATRPGFLTAIFFSFFINILAFVGPSRTCCKSTIALLRAEYNDVDCAHRHCGFPSHCLRITGENPLRDIGQTRYSLFDSCPLAFVRCGSEGQLATTGVEATHKLFATLILFENFLQEAA